MSLPERPKPADTGEQIIESDLLPPNPRKDPTVEEVREVIRKARSNPIVDPSGCPCCSRHGWRRPKVVGDVILVVGGPPRVVGPRMK